MIEDKGSDMGGLTRMYRRWYSRTGLAGAAQRMDAFLLTIEISGVSTVLN